MAAVFEVQGASIDGDRELLVLTGVVTDGNPRTGMLATVEGGVPDFEAPVHSIEVGASGLSLTFHFRDPDRLAGWGDVAWEGKKLDLGW